MGAHLKDQVLHLHAEWNKAWAGELQTPVQCS